MEQIKKNKKTILIIFIVLVIVGAVLVALKGFNKELKYQEVQSIDVHLGQEFDRNKVKNIANEVFGRRNVLEVVEIYEDMVTVRAKTISDEQKNDFVNKLKESYEFEQTSENTTIKYIPATKFRDMYSRYIMPFVISGLIVLSYMVIRYYKVGLVNVLLRTIAIPVVAEILLFTIFAITRIPLGRITPTLFVLVYVASIFFATSMNDKELELKTEKDN